MNLRLDQKLAESWVQPNSNILDLGCGDGALLHRLSVELNASGYGLEIDPDKINIGIAKGLNIIQQDLNKGLSRFTDNSFDYVIMAQALQVIEKPDQLLLDMLRVGREAIITFPNFAHWKTRLYLAFKGQMPVSDALPYSWYDTPNIHLCTFNDFESLCDEHNIFIKSRIAINQNQKGSWLTRLFPNFFGEIAIYRLSLKDSV